MRKSILEDIFDNGMEFFPEAYGLNTRPYGVITIKYWTCIGCELGVPNLRFFQDLKCDTP